MGKCVSECMCERARDYLVYININEYTQPSLNACVCVCVYANKRERERERVIQAVCVCPIHRDI